MDLSRSSFRTALLLPALALALAGILLLSGCGSQAPVSETTATQVSPRQVSSGQICGEDIDRHGTEFIKNGGFANGMAEWKTVDVPGSEGTDLAQLVNDSSCGFSVLTLTRQGSGRTSGLIGLEQPLSADKGNLSSLKVQLVAKINQQYMTSDGILGGETPVFVTLDYVTASGEVKSWTHGLLVGKVDYPNRDQSIPAGYWYTYKSENLLTMLPDLASVRKVTVGGNGKDFASQIAFVSLLGK